MKNSQNFKTMLRTYTSLRFNRNYFFSNFILSLSETLVYSIERIQGQIQEFLVGGGGGGGPNSTRYVETVLQLVTFTPRQFSVIVHHIPQLQPFRLFEFKRLKVRGHRLSRCHIARSIGFCKCRARLLCEQSQQKSKRVAETHTNSNKSGT